MWRPLDGAWRWMAGLPAPLQPVPRRAADWSRPCLSLDLYRLAFDSHTGRLHGRGHLVFGVWTAHLVDCVLSGVLGVDPDTGAAWDCDDGTAVLHPLVQDAWCLLRAGLPRAARDCFRQDVAPMARHLDQAAEALYRSGTHSALTIDQRRALLAPGGDPLRTAALRALAASHTITVPPQPDRIIGPLAGSPLGAQVNAVLAAAEAMRNLSAVNLPPTGIVAGGGLF